MLAYFLPVSVKHSLAVFFITVGNLTKKNLWAFKFGAFKRMLLVTNAGKERSLFISYRLHECSAGSQNAHQPAQTFTSHPNAHPHHPAPVVPQHNETSANKFFPDPDLTCRLVSGTREGGFVTAPVSRGPGTSVGSVALTQRGSPTSCWEHRTL